VKASAGLQGNITTRLIVPALFSPTHYSTRPRPRNFGPITDQNTASALASKLSHDERLLLLEELKRSEEDKKSSSSENESSGTSYAKLFIFAAISFIPFGFLDNLIMIIAGENIERTFGNAFAISTMASAALGNTVSDVIGILAQGPIESWLLRIFVFASPFRATSFLARLFIVCGRIVGITVGCLLGMFPLLFYSDDEDKEAKCNIKTVD
jgi:hypothetical protein